MVIGGAANVSIVIRAIDKFSKVFGQAKKEMTGFAGFVQANKKALLGFGAAGIAAGAAIGFGLFKATKGAIQLEEINNRFQTVFSGVSDAANAMSDELRKSYRISERSAKTFLGTTGDILVGLGQSEEQALALAGASTKMALDLASFTDVPVAQAARAITSAMVGERESLKTLGIVIRETDVKQKLLERGQQDLTGSALSAAKATATFDLIMEQSQKAQGDAIKTQDEASNKAKQLKESMQDLSDQIGTQLIPAFTFVVDKISALVGWFSGLTEGQKKFIAIAALVVAGLLLLGGTIAIVSVAVGALTAVSLPWLAIILAIIAAVALVILIIKNWSKIMDFLRERFEAVKADFVKFKDTIISIWESIKQKIKSTVDFIVNLFKKLITIAIKVAKFTTPIGLAFTAGKAIVGAVNKSRSKKQGDFISRPGQPPVPFSSKDTIIGTKGGLPGKSIVVNIGTVQGVNAEDISDALQRELRQIVFTT